MKPSKNRTLWSLISLFFLTSFWSCRQSSQKANKPACINCAILKTEVPVPQAAPSIASGTVPLPTGYYAFDSAIFNLNGDAWPDKLRALEPQSSRTKEGYYHPVVIYQLLRGTGKNSFDLWGENKVLLKGLGNNCPADGYQKIVAKPPYFTIEQVVCTDFKFARQFVTFKYNQVTNQVLLHKWGEEYTDRSNPDNPLADFIHTPADFGAVYFEEAAWEKVRD